MKFLTVFYALLAVACAGRSWDMQQLSRAIDSQHTDPILKHYLLNALDSMVEDLMSGIQTETVTVVVPASTLPSVALNDLSHIIFSPNADPLLLPAYVAAQDQIMNALISGGTEEAAFAPLAIPAMEIHHYSLFELSEALHFASDDDQIVPYLEDAVNKMVLSLHQGVNMEFIVLAVPTNDGGIVAGGADNVVVPPSSVDPSPVAPVQPSSPLVQIMVNVQ